MAKYLISSPDGGQFEIEAPDDATQEQVLKYAQENMPQQQTAQQPEQQGGALSKMFGDTGSQVEQLVKKQEEMSMMPDISKFQSSITRGITAPFVGAGQMAAEGVAALTDKPEIAQTYNTFVKQWDSSFEKNTAGEIIGSLANPAARLIGPGAARTVLGSAAENALQPVTEPTTDFVERKKEQAALGAVGGATGAIATKLAGKALNPLVSKAEATMRDLGVTPTVGQMMGGQTRKIEEFAQNLPLVGSYISKAKDRQLFNFNKGVINNALNKIDDKLPADVIGRDAVQFANNVVDKKYDDVLSKIDYTFKFPVYSSILNTIKKAPLTSAADKQRFNDEVRTWVFDRMGNNKLSGQDFKKLESDLMGRVISYKKGATQAEKDIGNALGDVLTILKQDLRKQNPEQSSILRRIDSAYGDLLVMRTAAANSGALNGVFSPKQYLTAVRQRDHTRNKALFASGQARGQDIAEAAVDMLQPLAGSTVEGRVSSQIMGGLGTIAQPHIAAPLAFLSPVLYSDSGMKAMQALMSKRPEVAKNLGKILEKGATAGSITGARVVEEYNKEIKNTKY